MLELGFIAMSGLRVQNPTLVANGLTLPGFLERSKVIASLPSLALLTLAGLTPDSVNVTYLEVADVALLEQLPGHFDAVAISSYTAQINEAYSLADRYRRRGIKVILGGLHVSALPDEAACHADALVLGEGELVWPTLIKDLLNNRLKKIYDARNVSFDLAQAPMPRYDLLDIDHYNRITVQTQRGCPFSCEFCAASIRLSPRFKTKPVAKVIQEIQLIKQLWDKPFIEFADDNTFANPAHGKRLLKQLAKENVRWFTETDISIAEDEELLALLKDSGCAQVLIGFESPQVSILNGIETKTNWKAKQASKYLRAIEKIQRHGITINGCFMLGLDGTTQDSFKQVADFVAQSALYEVQVTVQTAFPGTPLYSRLQREGRLIQADAWETCTLFDVNFMPDKIDKTELEEQFLWLVKTLYNEDTTRQRRHRYRKNLRQSQRLAAVQQR